jgi:MtaA/CmuA family methyltransferase
MSEAAATSDGAPTQMTSRERTLAALRREPVDRTPVVNPTSVATVELMDLVDAPFPLANREPELMARLAATGHTELGFDSIMPVFSIIQESSALGCKIQWEQKDNWPTVMMREPIFLTPDDIRIPDDFLDHPDTRCVIDAIKILRREFGDEVAIIGKTMGPWSLGYHCFGVEPFLLLSLDDPVATKLCLDRLKEATIEFGLAQIEAGADALTLPDHATGDLVSGEYYDRYLRELHIEFAERLSVPIILHICGKTVDRMEYIAQTGMAAFHYDSKNEPAESMAVVDGRISLVGNVNNPETLFSKGHEEVRAEVWRNLDAGVQMVGPECAIPLQTSIDNLLAIRDAVLEWHRLRGNGEGPGDEPERELVSAGAVAVAEPETAIAPTGPPLADVTNEFVRQEIDEYVDRQDERDRLIRLFAQASEEMQAIAAALIEGEDEIVDELTRAALERDVPALEIMDNGLIAGMAVVGIKFRENFIYVPEVLACARAMKAGMAHVEPILSASGIEPLATVVMGTVKGDLHDIGKNLCIMMLRGSGFEVVDLGVDTSPDQFIESVHEHGPQLLGMSALLTTTMPNMGKTIEAFIDAGLRERVKIIVGGAPVTQEFAEDMGADGYGKDAVACVTLAKQLVGVGARA